MSFLDYILSSFGIHEIKEEQKTNFNFGRNYCKEEVKEKLAIFYPKTLNEMTNIAKVLSMHKQLILDFNNLEKTDKQRGLDFIFGAAIGSKSNYSKLYEGVFVFTPQKTNY